MNSTFLVGTYTHFDLLAHQPKSSHPGLGSLICSLDSKSGKINIDGHFECINPAVITLHPKLKVVYLICERIDKSGEIIVCDFNDSGELKKKSVYHSTGKSTCFFSIDPNNHRRGIVVSYWDSIVELVSLDKQGNIVELTQRIHQIFKKERRQVVSREDHWSHRQDGPHAHAAKFWNQWIFISDLGENAIFQYILTNQHGLIGLTLDHIIPLTEHTGPRHFTFHPKLPVAYISNELNSSVVACLLDESHPTVSKPRIKPIQYIKTIPESSTVPNYVSEIFITQDGKHLYCSNRGENVISLFNVLDSGELSDLKTFSTQGSCPRHFSLSTDEQYVLVTNQDSNSICVFERNRENGELTFVNDIQIFSPNYIKFLS